MVAIQNKTTRKSGQMGGTMAGKRRPEPVFRGGYSYMTSKGQVTITANLREALGLKAGDRVLMMLQDDGTLKLQRIKGIIEVIDSLPKRQGKGLSTREMGELTQKALARQAMKHDPAWRGSGL